MTSIEEGEINEKVEGVYERSYDGGRSLDADGF